MHCRVLEGNYVTFNEESGCFCDLIEGTGRGLHFIQEISAQTTGLLKWVDCSGKEFSWLVSMPMSQDSDCTTSYSVKRRQLSSDQSIHKMNPRDD